MSGKYLVGSLAILALLSLASAGDKKFVFFEDTKCHKGKVIVELTKKTDDENTKAWKNTDNCNELCYKDKKCEYAQFNKKDKRCVLYRDCKTLFMKKGYNIAARTNFGEYFCAPFGVQCDKSTCGKKDVVREFEPGVKSFWSCKDACDDKTNKGCKHFEFFYKNKVCKLYKIAPTLTATSKAVRACKKKKST